MESEGKKDIFNSIVVLDEDKKEVVLGFKKIIKNGKAKLDFKQDISSLLKNNLKKLDGPIFYLRDECEELDLAGCRKKK